MKHEQLDVAVTQGRKGVAYDWQSIYVAAQMESLDRELATVLAGDR